MTLHFPSDFFWGVSTASAQIETASDHNWRGVKAIDGSVFERTTDHERQREKDADLVSKFGSVYRCGVDWARLQTEPFHAFDENVVKEYQDFFQKLNDNGTKIMFVLHHFAHPNWFEKRGAFEYEENIAMFIDFCQKAIHYFGKYVNSWNTFNEPNVYVVNGYLTGDFPPFKKAKLLTANRVLTHLGQAHDAVFQRLKLDDDTKQVGISLNTCLFEGFDPLGWALAKTVDYLFNKRTPDFFKNSDFIGMSYYAYMPFNPLPISEIKNPGKLAAMGITTDKMWGYKPEGLLKNMLYLWKKYKKPIVITENGICTTDDEKRIGAIQDYLQQIHIAINQHSVRVNGFIHWSAWDNFEWNLGNTYCFGLMRTNFDTMERIDTKSADFYRQITAQNAVPLGNFESTQTLITH